MAQSIADYFGGLNALQDQQVLASQGRQNLINETYKPFDKELLVKALAEGGSLSNAPSMTENAMFAMTPDTFQTTMKNYVPLSKRISDAVQLNDMVTGNSANLKSATQLEQARLQGAQHNIGTAAQMLEKDQNLEQRTQQHADTLAQSDKQHTQTLAEQKRQHDATYHLGMEHLKLTASQYKYARDAQAALLQGGQPPAGSQTDVATVGAMDKQLKELGALNKDGTKFDIGEVSAEQKTPALQAYMVREAAKGLPYMQRYNVSESHQPYLGGYKQLVLGSDGWHGVAVGRDGKEQATNTPVVPFVQRPKPRASGGAGSAGYTQQPGYGYTPE